MAVKLNFEIPDSTAPGFLKRNRDALVFREKLQSQDVKPEALDALVEYLTQYVTEPEGEQEKRDALWMASEDEFMRLLNALTGAENPTEQAQTS